jgi:hypothetical protein
MERNKNRARNFISWENWKNWILKNKSSSDSVFEDVCAAITNCPKTVYSVIKKLSSFVFEKRIQGGKKSNGF